MGDRIDKENEILEESYTEFPAHKSGYSGLGSGRGMLARFFRRFGAGQPEPTRGRPKNPVNRLEGDTFKREDDEFPVGSGVGFGVSRSFPMLPQIEYDRRRRYKEFEQMDEYPEIGAAMDIYADDGTQKNIDKTIFEIESNTQLAKEVSERFLKNVRMDDFIWDVFRNVVKYGDCFIENIVDLNNAKAGIQRVKILNPNYLVRVENKYGYLEKFMQEIPQSRGAGDGGTGSEISVGTGKFMDLDKEQIVHFRTHTSDPNFYPYGKSILAPGVRAWKSLRMMEDAMLIYRLSRAPERRIWKIDTGNLPTSKAEAYIERVKQKLKKEKHWDPTSRAVNERYNPLSVDEDFFIGIKNKSLTTVDVLPGAQNLGDIDDVKYFRDKLLAALKIPKDYVVEKDKSPERKANLAQLDVKFARSITRIQREVEIGINLLVRRHLKLRGFPTSTVKEVSIFLCPPSDMFEKRRLELDEQKIRVVQAISGLQMFPKEWILKNYFNLSDQEIREITEKLEEEMEKEAEMQAAAAPPMMGGGEPGMEEPMPGMEEPMPGMEEPMPEGAEGV